MRRWRLIFLLIIAALPFFFVDIGPGPKSSIVQLYGFAHFFFFALVAWWLSGVFSSSRHSIFQQMGLIMLIVFLGGGAIELIQPVFGRDAGWRHLGVDVLGGLFGIVFWVPVRHQIPVSIRDHAHFRRGGEYHERFNRKFVLRPGWNDVAIPIVDIQNAPLERKLELDDLSEVVIFTVDPPAPRRMYLDYVRLIE